MKKILYPLFAIVGIVLLMGLFTTKKVYTQIDINAPAAEVWQHLTTFNNYPQWNPFVIKAAGHLSPGAKLDVTIHSGLGGEMDFTLTVGNVEAPHQMVWLGQTLLPKLLDGEHIFTIEPISDTKVRFINQENYSGLLLFPAWPIISPDARQGFEAMNQALKQRVEGGA